MKDPHWLEKLTVQSLLPHTLRDKYAQGKLPRESLQPFANRIRIMSDEYVTGSRSSAKVIKHHDDALAYALYYMPINFAKVTRLLRELPSNFHPERIYDFGCGPGTAALACVATWDRKLEIHASEPNTHMRDVADKLLHAAKHHAPQLHTHVSNASPSRSDFDLIIAANVLSENRAQSLDLALALSSMLTPHGCLMLIEPGMQAQTRELMTVRNELIKSEPTLVPLFPCTHAQPCPMLAQSERDWCHDTLTWHAPPLVQQLDEITGFNKHRIKYSAFIFQKHGQLRGGLRIVSDVERSKGQYHFKGCGTEFFGSKIVAKSESSERPELFGWIKE